MVTAWPYPIDNRSKFRDSARRGRITEGDHISCWDRDDRRTCVFAQRTVPEAIEHDQTGFKVSIEKKRPHKAASLNPQLAVRETRKI